MLPRELSLVGISARIVDCADAVEDSAVSCKGVSVDGDDDPATRQTEKGAVFRFGGAGDQPLRRRMGRQPAIFKMTVERKTRIADALLRQVDTLDQRFGQHRTMARDRDIIDQSQPVEQHQFVVLVIGHAALPRRRAIVEQAVRRLVSAGGNRLGKAQKIARRTSQRRFGHEGAAALPARDQTFFHEDFNGPRDREPTHGKLLGQLRLAWQPRSGVHRNDPRPQCFCNLKVSGRTG